MYFRSVKWARPALIAGELGHELGQIPCSDGWQGGQRQETGDKAESELHWAG